MCACSVAGHLIALHGLQEGEWSVSMQCKKLIQAQFGLVMANITPVTVLPYFSGPLAILDFSMASETVDAATFLEVLDGMSWNESVLRAHVYKGTDVTWAYLHQP